VIRVLLAEDSAVTRMYLQHVLEGDPEIRVVAVAANGEEAVALASRERPDVVLMDVHMPALDGYEAARAIMRATPLPIVMTTASSGELGTHGGFRALEAGALVIVEKPPGLAHPRHEEVERELLRTLKLMAEVKVVRRWRDGANAEPPRPPAVPTSPCAIAIGASTGGPPVVAELLRALPATLDAPVLVVQHIGEGFVQGFAEWLATVCPRPVAMARQGRPADGGTVYVAGGGAHLGLSRDRRLTLEQGPPRHGFRPSISRLFESVAASCGPDAVGILLTGMGRDGADGLLALRDAGATTIAQDEASSVIYGMPAEAVRLGAARHVLAPAGIAALLQSLDGAGARA
jgi:two-component system chemotaxis response regulator CheB